MIPFDSLTTNTDGLIPCIVIDHYSKGVLMLAYMNKEAYELTLSTNRMTYFSRSRQSLWEKGLTSGNTQKLITYKVDCDKDTLLFEIHQKGPACHTGQDSCFYPNIPTLNVQALLDLDRTISNRKVSPKEGSYTTYLFEKGRDKILKKIGEEASEIIIAAKNESSEELLEEAADFMYHLHVLLAEKDLSFSDVSQVLHTRHLK